MRVVVIADLEFGSVLRTFEIRLCHTVFFMCRWICMLFLTVYVKGFVPHILSMSKTKNARL